MDKEQTYQKVEFPAIFVLMGITGDLAKKKLLPSLFELFQKDLLPDKFKILGFSHTKLSGDGSDESIRSYVKDILKKDYPDREVGDFLSCIHYQQGDFTELGDFKDLKNQINELEEEFGQCANKLYHLAVPPNFYSAIFENLDKTELSEPCSRETGWARILVEKPFGSDIKSAKELDQKISNIFKEEQIFRIDHYLQKSMVQNILTFRFSNVLFEPVWNNEFINKVKIKMHEDFGVKGRGAFYDGVGALRDVGKNHCLQMLAMVAMENPGSLRAENIREKRASVLGDLKILKEQEVLEDTIRGQYKGYLDVEGVEEDSDTETFFRFTTEVENERWKGVEFEIEAGKNLHAKHACIKVEFNPSEFVLCPPEDVCEDQNSIEFKVQPKPSITVDFISRKPQFKYELEHQLLEFNQEEPSQIPEAYQKVLFDCIKGDQTMFASTEEIEASWKFADPILKMWDEGRPDLRKYEPGINPEEIN